MNETNKEIKQHISEDEPKLFEEKSDKRSLIKTKFTLVAIVALIVFVLWPKAGIEGEAVLQAEKFAKMGLTSSGVLKDLFHEKGEFVKEGDMIARFENPEILKRHKQAALELERLEDEKVLLNERLKYLDKVKERTRMLYENGVVGNVSVEDAQFDFTKATQEFVMIEKRIRAAKEELDFLLQEIESLELKAPFDGVLLTDPSDTVGSPIKKGEFVLEIADPNTYFLEVLIAEKDVEKVSIGNKVKVRFHAFSHKSYSGEITQIAPRTTQEVEKVFKIRHVVACQIKLRKVPDSLRYGMRASVKVKARKRFFKSK